jgi:serine/threonine-protein kinase RsbW
MGDGKTLVLRNRFDEMGRLFETFESFCRKKCEDARFKYAVQVSLEEIFTNIVKYGYQDEMEHEIIIRFEVVDRRLRISFEDDGIAFNPLAAADPDVEASLKNRRVGGLGIHMVRSLMDQVAYERVHDKNILIVEKKIDGESVP